LRLAMGLFRRRRECPWSTTPEGPISRRTSMNWQMRVITGGQVGTDQGALRAARVAGLLTGGWAPQGWMTEGGAGTWLADFGLVECPRAGYPRALWWLAKML